MTLLDVQAIRRANLLLLLKECGEGRGSAAKLSRLTGVPQPYISQLKRQTKHSEDGPTRTMGDPTARALEKGMSKPVGWMDHDHSGTLNDRALRLAARFSGLTPDQQRIIEQTAEAFASSNGSPPPEDGPAIRAPKPRRH